MAATEGDIIRDERERNNLQKALAGLETAITLANPGIRRVLVSSLEGVKSRISALDKKIEDAKIGRATEVQTQVATAVALAAKETKLNESERETYRGFLEEAYFTKKDFGRLDEFYTHSYDRLSEGGKDEMSKRLHESIRRGEFKFTELSKAIQERDDAHCVVKAAKDNPAQPHILPSKNETIRTPEDATKTTIGSIDLRSVDLSGIKLADVSGSVSTSCLPDASSPKITQR